MTSARVISVDGKLAILLPPTIAEQSGWQEGDTVKIEFKDRSLPITRTLTAEERALRTRTLTKEILDQRADAYRALAQIKE